MIKIEGLDHANQMKDRAQHCEYVEDLMRISPNVKCAWLQALGESCLYVSEVAVSNISGSRSYLSSYLPHKPKRQ